MYLHLIAPPKLENGLPNIDESWGNFGSDAGDELESESLPKVNMHTFYIGRVQDFNRFVASIHRPAGERPTLYFLHILMPHGPWLYYPNGRVRAVANPKAPGRTHELWWSSSLAIQAWQRHLLQVGYTDELLGRLVKRLKSVGLWDKSLVLVDPDHGISFRGGDKRREPTRTNLSDLAFIPFFVKLPGQKTGRIVDTHITTEDILPTIADVLGVDIPWSTTGSSALTGDEGQAARPGREGRGLVRGPARAAQALAHAHALSLRQRRLGPAFLGDRPVLAARRQAGRFAGGRGERRSPRGRRRGGEQAAAFPPQEFAAGPVAAVGKVPGTEDRRHARARAQRTDRGGCADVLVRREAAVLVDALRLGFPRGPQRGADVLRLRARCEPHAARDPSDVS